MSATILFRVVKPAEGHLSVGYPSAFVSAMRRAFGEPPWTLGAESIVKLEGMAATAEEKARENPYQQMIDKIQLEDGSAQSIEVWPSY